MQGVLLRRALAVLADGLIPVCVCRRGGGQEGLPALRKPGDLCAPQHVCQFWAHLLWGLLRHAAGMADTTSIGLR